MKKSVISIIILIFFLFQPVLAESITLKQEFLGSQGDVHESIVERIKANHYGLSTTNLNEIESFHEQTLLEIKKVLAAHGYFRPNITFTKKYDRNNLIIRYFINSGELLYINKLDLQVLGEGLNDPAFQKLLKNFPIKQGNVVRSKLYQEAKSSLVDLAAQRGYFAAKIEKSNIFIDLKTYQANVILYFNTGPRYYFGELEFLPSPYSTKFLQRFVPFKYQKPYQDSNIVKLQENLSSSNFFQQVTITPKPELAHNLLVPIQVEVIPRKAVQYNIGAGFGTDTGFRGLLDIQYRRLNPQGHRLDMLIQPSEKLNHYEASYSIPGKNPVTDLYKLSFAAENQHLETSGKSRNEKIEAGRISHLWGWQQTLSLSLRDEHSIPTDDRPIINSTMLLPNLNWSRVKTDDPLSPNMGYQLNINIKGATKKLISNTDFIQALIQGKAIAPLSSNNRLIIKGQIGYTFISDIDQLPISLQFYTGGAQTVRGYKYEGIGPGKTLILGSLELQQRIKGNLYAAIFFDSGSVSNSLANNFHSGLGIGLVWRSPIGAIEVTLAQALNRPGHPKLLQFSMGPEL